MAQYRDIYLKQQSRLAKKQDRLQFKRAVLTTSGGSLTATDPQTEVWASASERRAWYMHEGAVQPAQILCRKISNPYVGLGVIIGYADGSNQLEVLSDDFFLTGTGSPAGWVSTGPADLEPGGNKQLWIYTKTIVPLATYPGTGVAVNVTNGDYPYLGARKTYNGSVDYSLASSVPGGGLCRYAGLYLDATNTLQTIDGATTTAGSTPAEPTWPAGAFRLCVVLLTNGDTSIDFANIYDRRMAWSDEQGGGIGGNVWPKPDKLNISDTEYSTAAAAVAALGANEQLLIGEGSFACSNQTISVVADIKGSGLDVSILTVASAATTLHLSGTAHHLSDFTTRMTASATGGQIALHCNGTDAILDIRNVKVSQVSAAGGTHYAALFDISSNGIATLTDCVLIGDNSGGGTVYALEVDTGTVNVYGGLAQGNVRASGGTTLNLYGPRITGTITNSGTMTGWYYDANGNLIVLDATGTSSGIWLIDESATLKTKEVSLAAAVTAAASSGDSIKLDTDTYTYSSTLSIGKSLTIEGDGPEATIINFTGSNLAAIDLTTDSTTIIFRNLTLNHAGGGTAATGIFSNNAVTVVLDNAQVLIPSGAGTDSRPLWIEAGTWELRNGAKAKSTSGTNKYGIYNDSAAATITIGPGCEVGGATQDIYGDQSGSTITLNSAILTNGLISWAGIINWLPENKIVKNLLVNSLTHASLWQRGTTLNDLADDSYGPDCWTVLNKDNAPDISRQTGGSTDPFEASFRCTFDSNSAQAGIVHFLKSADTVPLRGQTVSLSADLWGTNVTSLRMGVITWTGTADTLTSDVVGSWATGNPTLATSWAYIGTPAAITISTTRTRYAVNNLFVPTNANNLAVFIWTDAAESSGDLWEVARVQLEPGPVATSFVARAEESELILSQHFAWAIQPDQKSQGQGAKVSSTVVAVLFKNPVTMRANPTLTHNITGYTSGSPTTTTVALVDYARNAFYAITGALTVSLGNAGKDHSTILFTAGTSWDGTAGNLTTFQAGPDVIAILSADL
jgi:YD repeat-containing protein